MPRKKDRWPELCELVAQDDGLPVREVGPWTEDKLFFWNRYLDITTSAMVGKRQWSGGLIYVDLFAGSGVCRVRDNSRRIPGSAVIAAKTSKPFRRVIACELDPSNASALETRLRSVGSASEIHVIVGDCNQLISSVVDLIPRGALTVAFIDPPGLDAHFSTIEALSSAGRVDLLILFADAVDAIRNDQLYRLQIESRLDRVFGANSDWRDRLDEVLNPDGTQKRKVLAQIYIEQLRKLRYVQFGEKTMKSDKGPLYKLVYASKHERGLEFWEKVTRIDRRGQKGFDY